MFWIYYTLTWCALVLLWTKIVQDKFEYEKKNIVIYMKIIMIVIITLTIESFRKSGFEYLFFIT